MGASAVAILSAEKIIADLTLQGARELAKEVGKLSGKPAGFRSWIVSRMFGADPPISTLINILQFLNILHEDNKSLEIPEISDKSWVKVPQYAKVNEVFGEWFGSQFLNPDKSVLASRKGRALWNFWVKTLGEMKVLYYRNSHKVFSVPENTLKEPQTILHISPFAMSVEIPHAQNISRDALLLKNFIQKTIDGWAAFTNDDKIDLERGATIILADRAYLEAVFILRNFTYLRSGEMVSSDFMLERRNLIFEGFGVTYLLMVGLLSPLSKNSMRDKGDSDRRLIDQWILETKIPNRRP
jgi:hypothetical protein